jgi:hypothetical protein
MGSSRLQTRLIRSAVALTHQICGTGGPQQLGDKAEGAMRVDCQFADGFIPLCYTTG